MRYYYQELHERNFLQVCEEMRLVTTTPIIYSNAENTHTTFSYSLIHIFFLLASLSIFFLFVVEIDVWNNGTYTNRMIYSFIVFWKSLSMKLLI